ncbi:phosphate/phosphite/phosphonate ABC transporter substrate-binding protein [Celeribacter sp. ULVN23_4]
MIAQLPMYLRPGNPANLAAHEALWELIRHGLRARDIPAPEKLDDNETYDVAWAREDLCLSQICNLPLRGSLKDKVTRIGASDYGLEGCAPGYYRSFFVVHEDHPAQDADALDGLSMAYNDAMSHSGWGAPWLWAHRRGISFRPVLATGAHAASVSAVLRREVDFAAIDAQSFRILQAERPEMTRLRVIGATEASPGQTFCTARDRDPAPYFAAISEAIARLSEPHRAQLGLRGIVALPDDAYDLPLPPDPLRLSRSQGPLSAA